MRRRWVAAAVLLGARGLLAQQAGSAAAFESFEVASIKPSPPDAPRGRYIRMMSAHQLIARNHSAKTLIQAAYNLNGRSIDGLESWAESEHWDIQAKVAGAAAPSLDDRMAMLRELLSERFKLSFHRETRQMPVYALVVAKGGPKFLRSEEREPPPEGFMPLMVRIAPPLAQLPGRHSSMAEVASVMQRAALNRPVIDKTGLAGFYDFDLEWTPDEREFGGMLGHPPPADETTKPGLFAAIQQQLGLRLEAQRGPVEVMVIDHLDRPSAN